MSASSSASVVTSGRFVWYELQTTDTRAAQEFYGSVVGWGTQDGPVPDMAYTILTAGGTPVGGLMDHGTPPGWIGYVGVKNVDEVAGQVARLGGSVHVPPTDIPTVGRFAVVADPQKVVFALFSTAEPGADEPPAPAPGTPGHIGWHELLTTDWQKAVDFYGEMFGWRKDHEFDMGAMGTYQIFSIGGVPAGGMFNKQQAETAPYWRYYFNVEDIDAASARVTAGGGKVVNGPMQVPGGDWIIHGLDPQGADFALVGKRR
ncbi:VOC family protein [Acidiphilium sp. AL]|uniref:VOC family protein n=1 Tax=Acidiphilium sp. AL TaxID=2871704 RepID=UPI0021CB7FB0|nr:VOC family protein [Acidiphilium sp. AL]MCU4159420.1 VOC family protein [Acidiphilium sp. AL]